MPHEHWYEVVESPALRQGDIFRGIRCFSFADELTPDADEVAVEHRDGDWIVAQASCDMDARGFSQVLVIPVLRADRETLRIGAEAPDDELRKRQEVIRRGLHPRRFMLPEKPDDPASLPLSIAAWDAVAVVPRAYLQTHYCAGPRLRLRHPFREQFGNWVGARITAVGPENEGLIPAFRNRVHDAHVLDADEAP